MLDCIRVTAYTENSEDIQIVSESVDDVRHAVTSYLVSGDHKWFLRAPLFTRPAQTVHRQAIFDQNLKLIVSHKMDAFEYV